MTTTDHPGPTGPADRAVTRDDVTGHEPAVTRDRVTGHGSSPGDGSNNGRLCDCGCGEPVPSPKASYAGTTCRKRAERQRRAASEIYLRVVNVDGDVTDIDPVVHLELLLRQLTEVGPSVIDGYQALRPSEVRARLEQADAQTARERARAAAAEAAAAEATAASEEAARATEAAEEALAATMAATASAEERATTAEALAAAASVRADDAEEAAEEGERRATAAAARVAELEQRLAAIGDELDRARHQRDQAHGQVAGHVTAEAVLQAELRAAEARAEVAEQRRADHETHSHELAGRAEVAEQRSQRLEADLDATRARLETALVELAGHRAAPPDSESDSADVADTTRKRQPAQRSAST